MLENIRLAFEGIWSHKLRSILTMLGIIIGIAAVIAIMTVGNSQTEQVREQYASFGTNNVDVYMWLADEINMDDLNDSENGDNSKYIPNFTEDMMNNMLLTYGERIDAVSVTSWMSGGGKAVRTGTPENYSERGSLPPWHSSENSDKECIPWCKYPFPNSLRHQSRNSSCSSYKRR